MTFTVNQPITYELIRPLTTDEAYVVNILLYKPTNAIVAIARPIEERIADGCDPIVGALLERFGAARRIMPMLKLTLYEPTADERLLLNPSLQVAELLGGKSLDWNGTPLRVLVYRYSDGIITFACRTEQPRSFQVQTYAEEYINSGFSSEDQFWVILMSFLKPLA